MSFDIAEFPVEIEFHIPSHTEPVELQWEDETGVFRQLVCWCIIQRYRYYVLNDPAVSDMEYDNVEKFVLEMRGEADYIAKLYCPLTEPGSSRKEDYPSFIRHSFDSDIIS